jgi:hypothetical protein
MAAITDNILIPLPELILPKDFSRQVRFIATINEQLRRLRSSGNFVPPRFFGYFFQGRRPVGVCGNWIVTLDAIPQLNGLATSVERMTHGQFSICSDTYEKVPDFILVNDSHDGACWLWRFSYGLRFAEAVDPVSTNGHFNGEPPF